MEKLYDNLLYGLETVIESQYALMKDMEDEDMVFAKHYVVQGLEIAKQYIEQSSEVDPKESAYEVLEETIRAMKDSIPIEEVEELVIDIYSEGEW